LSLQRLWALSGALAVVLFGCGLLFGDLLASSNYPALNAPGAKVRSYFLHDGFEVRALAFFHVLAALTLLCFALYLQKRISEIKRSSGGAAATALAGGATAAVFLLLSALMYRTLAEPAVTRNAALTHALVVISYLAGGPAVAVPLALMIAVTIRSLRQPTLPRWTGCLGVSAVVFSVLSAGILLGPMNNSSAWYGVLLLAAVLGFVWTFVTSIALASSSDAALMTKA
jgi:hypothetical protein